MNNIDYSEHAERRIKERNIDRTIIEEVIKKLTLYSMIFTRTQ